MTDRLLLDAPAKINLSLTIHGRRPDGFHEISSRMVPLSLSDRLTVSLLPELPAGSVHFSCSDPSLPADGSNLAIKAVHSLAALCGPLPALAIHLEKHIPHGAGLGGGSSDAAAVLRGLGSLLRLPLSPGQLHAAAAAIGSDVPFFLHQCACDVSGRGEIVTPLPAWLTPLRILLVKLPFSVPTPWAYQQWASSTTIDGLPYGPQQHAGETFVNSLERPVFARFPILGLLKAELLATPGVNAALMSGSGSTIFAVLSPSASLTSVIGTIHRTAGTEVWIRETQPLIATAD
jgi:4-diphosphocytidyl-2-C-methyl-D-erythritol kinase